MKRNHLWSALFAVVCPLVAAAQGPAYTSPPAPTTPPPAYTTPPPASTDPLAGSGSTELKITADPHAIIPTDPGASLVMTESGLAVERNGEVVALTPGARQGTTVVQSEGPSTVVVTPGEEARTGYGVDTRAPDRLREQQRATRQDTSAPVMNSILLAPRGIALLDRVDRIDRNGERAGLLGLELDHVLGGPLSLVTGVDFGLRDRGPGLSDDTTVGLNGGVNLFLLGGHNEGLYVGPRVTFAAAGVPSAVDSAGDRFGYGGEVGLRAVVGGGFTAGLAAGVLNQTRGTVNYGAGRLGSPTSRDNFGYGALQVGWSW